MILSLPILPWKRIFFLVLVAVILLSWNVGSMCSAFTLSTRSSLWIDGGRGRLSHHINNNNNKKMESKTFLYSSSSSSNNHNNDHRNNDHIGLEVLPQVIATGCSQKSQLIQAVQEATERALRGLPALSSSSNNNKNNHVIDVALVSVSSLYDGQPWSAVVPTIYQTCYKQSDGASNGDDTGSRWQLDHVVGCTTAGVISSTSSSSSWTPTSDGDDASSTASTSSANPNGVQPVEWEGLLGVSVTLMQLPDTSVQIFHVLGEDVPDDLTRVTSETWQRAIGITTKLERASGSDGSSSSMSGSEMEEESVICLFPSPSFQTQLDDLIRGFTSTFGNKCNTLMGAVASTVSSLSRARLFAYRHPHHRTNNNNDITNLPTTSTTTTYTEGCVGIMLQGDVQVRTLMASGAKPVGGIYRIVKGQESTIQVIVLDEEATKELLPAELEQDETKASNNEEDDDDDDDTTGDSKEDDKERRKRLMQEAYAKAAIPKPTLAEANFVMRALSDDEQAFMRKAILVGLERPGRAMLPIRRAISPMDVKDDDDNDDDDDDDDDDNDDSGNIPSKDQTSSSSSSSPTPPIPPPTTTTTTTTLGRLAQGLGHGYTVHQVASAGMKDGSVTFALGSVTIQPGARMRFFVRERTFAKKEIQALWMGYKKRVLNEQFSTTTTTTSTSKSSTLDSSTSALGATFTPTGCFVFPTLDRGTKFFLGKPGFESRQVAQFLPTIPSIAGFFCNSVIGTLDDTSATNPRLPNDSFLHGSASGYFLIGSKSKRPIYSPALAAAEQKKRLEDQALEKAKQEEEELQRERQAARAKVVANVNVQSRAPRDANGELMLKRREIHAGRAISVSTVEWSVADKTAMPTSTLEGYMWDKETEVDRFRERVPLSNLVSQCRLSMVDPNMPKPRDFVGPIVQAAQRQFVIVPECKRKEPTTGSIRKRYEVSKLVKQFTLAGSPAISVNCDAVLFGGSLEDITKAREAATSAAVSAATLDSDGVLVPPILASDLVLYPYQLYKLRLAGADAVNLVVGALASKDVIYLTKIASSLQLQCLVTVTSEVQIRALSALSPGSVNGLIVSNRELEDFSFDMTGQQALDLLASEALADFQKKQTRQVPVLVEGRVGIISRPDESGADTPQQYIKELKAAGAIGAIVGEGIAQDESIKTLEALQSSC